MESKVTEECWASIAALRNPVWQVDHQEGRSHALLPAEACALSLLLLNTSRGAENEGGTNQSLSTPENDDSQIGGDGDGDPPVAWCLELAALLSIPDSLTWLLPVQREVLVAPSYDSAQEEEESECQVQLMTMMPYAAFQSSDETASRRKEIWSEATTTDELFFSQVRSLFLQRVPSPATLSLGLHEGAPRQFTRNRAPAGAELFSEAYMAWNDTQALHEGTALVFALHHPTGSYEDNVLPWACCVRVWCDYLESTGKIAQLDDPALFWAKTFVSEESYEECEEGEILSMVSEFREFFPLLKGDGSEPQVGNHSGLCHWLHRAVKNKTKDPLRLLNRTLPSLWQHESWAILRFLETQCSCCRVTSGNAEVQLRVECGSSKEEDVSELRGQLIQLNRFIQAMQYRRTVLHACTSAPTTFWRRDPTTEELTSSSRGKVRHDGTQGGDDPLTGRPGRVFYDRDRYEKEVLDPAHLLCKPVEEGGLGLKVDIVLGSARAM